MACHASAHDVVRSENALWSQRQHHGVNRTRLFSRERYTYAIWGSPYYDISADGTRFIMSRPARSKNSERLVVVLNWFDELRGWGKAGSK